MTYHIAHSHYIIIINVMYYYPNIIIFKVGNNIRIKMNALWIW